MREKFHLVRHIYLCITFLFFTFQQNFVWCTLMPRGHALKTKFIVSLKTRA